MNQDVKRSPIHISDLKDEEDTLFAICKCLSYLEEEAQISGLHLVANLIGAATLAVKEVGQGRQSDG